MRVKHVCGNRQELPKVQDTQGTPHMQGGAGDTSFEDDDVQKGHGKGRGRGKGLGKRKERRAGVRERSERGGKRGNASI